MNKKLGVITSLFTEETHRVCSNANYKDRQPIYNILTLEGCLELLDKKLLRITTKMLDQIAFKCSDPSLTVFKHHQIKDLLGYHHRFSNAFTIVDQILLAKSYNLLKALREILNRNLNQTPFAMICSLTNGDVFGIVVQAVHKVAIFDPKKRSPGVAPEMVRTPTLEVLLSEIELMLNGTRPSEFIAENLSANHEIVVLKRSHVAIQELEPLVHANVRPLSAHHFEPVDDVKAAVIENSKVSEEENDADDGNDLSSMATEYSFIQSLICAQCRNFREPSAMTVLSKCKHQICFKCLHAILVDNISSGKSPTFCPFCLREIAFEDVELALSDNYDLLSDYARLLQLAHQAGSPIAVKSEDGPELNSRFQPLATYFDQINKLI